LIIYHIIHRKLFGNKEKRSFDMISTKSVSKTTLSKLPEEVLRLVSMGQYSLYKVTDESALRIVYALRTGATKVFLLGENGEPIKEKVKTSFSIENKVHTSVPSFCLQK
jgi:hypothetical protein